MTTARVTHATPGALYGHSFDRHFECDTNLGDVPEGVHDLAWQMINRDEGKNAKVIMGGGKKAFLPKKTNASKKVN